ncbi:hypothetical protein IV38_GL000198 [Lactobacillus selangorensis]|uniref:DUF1146 domain-containing protein n=1 Tax=Lactobacillus selangorensis TaxID=81857 RepID=A0A0R2G9W5_9LACO|nr:DUF1146 family protein [Lactobacillus selangorensis]KRN29315.1 hypothetical protein IV38_GL000198 [Lactobacillus selangorensis]KRN34156.1 hypothetical protein IV40_GL000471 [Lactobacillus selangorensis]
MRILGLQALVTIISHLGFILLSFRGLQALRFDQILKKNHDFEGRLIIVFLAIAIGFTVSTFFLNIVDQSRNLLFLFK